jgi:hypothetical protein
MCHDVMNIQLVQHGIRILGNFGETSIEMIKNGKGNLAQTCSEYDDLINLTHFFEEVVHTRALDYVDIVPVILDFDRYNIISLLNRLDRKVRHRIPSECEIRHYLEATMHQRLVEIKDEALASHVLRGDWGE